MAYCILRLTLLGAEDVASVHVSVADRKDHAVKDDTWQRGLKELQMLGLAHTESRKTTEDRWSNELRTRKVVYLDNDSVLGGHHQLIFRRCPGPILCRCPCLVSREFGRLKSCFA